MCETCGEAQVAVGPRFHRQADELWYRSAIHADISEYLMQPYPSALENVTQLPALWDAPRSCSVGESTITRVMGANLRLVLERVLGDAP
jgi:microsomal dipeptidase-like Zn-dependent dipeptidase